jgi:hypothetical protein
MSTTDLFKQGVLFTFQSSGVMGAFNFRALLNSLIQGSVLLSVAQVLVTLVASYGLGLHSKLYFEQMKETCDFKRIYAAFAANSLVASYAFRGMDVDSTGELDSREIFNMMKQLFGKNLNDREVAVLTEFLCTSAEKDDKDKKGRVARSKSGHVTSTINVSEWIDVLSSEATTFESLKRIVESEIKHTAMGQGVNLPGSSFKVDAIDPAAAEPLKMKVSPGSNAPSEHASISGISAWMHPPSNGGDSHAAV